MSASEGPVFGYEKLGQGCWWFTTLLRYNVSISGGPDHGYVRRELVSFAVSLNNVLIFGSQAAVFQTRQTRLFISKQCKIVSSLMGMIPKTRPAMRSNSPRFFLSDLTYSCPLLFLWQLLKFMLHSFFDFGHCKITNFQNYS